MQPTQEPGLWRIGHTRHRNARGYAIHPRAAHSLCNRPCPESAGIRCWGMIGGSRSHLTLTNSRIFDGHAATWASYRFNCASVPITSPNPPQGATVSPLDDEPSARHRCHVAPIRSHAFHSSPILARAHCPFLNVVSSEIPNPREYSQKNSCKASRVDAAVYRMFHLILWQIGQDQTARDDGRRLPLGYSPK